MTRGGFKQANNVTKPLLKSPKQRVDFIHVLSGMQQTAPFQFLSRDLVGMFSAVNGGGGGFSRSERLSMLLEHLHDPRAA